MAAEAEADGVPAASDEHDQVPFDERTLQPTEEAADDLTYEDPDELRWTALAEMVEEEEEEQVVACVEP
eukprot:CAMPEP_0168467964 /NCGR_PEP_ID=MMETSP0228-20121227/57460_1 /TAXON_ID=133427 /ORGANISM="Protoceratium reticulatum, Strain CCCM 535 (=CCMP 1889)" /LENGTH=68 /DNA_ID=CAMNT_0008483703 /DNA_START=1 /DNA_END=204 /DNA_ORIENTATION=-